MSPKDGAIAVVVLAAGGSSRLGRPKQLVPFRGSTLVRHAARTALEAALGPVIVVLGADAERCRAALAGLDVALVEHEGWIAGLGSTIRAGVAAVRQLEPSRDAILLTACDQPLVPASHLRALERAWRAAGCGIAATGYGGTTGVPALFGQAWLSALEKLPDEHGAKAVIAAAGGALAVVPCEDAALDVDEDDDVANLGRDTRE
jgi:molybdenum cofactor cytidylyltransferase